MFNQYSFVVDSLYKTVDEVEVPITDVDGDTALLTTDGTSWRLDNQEWVQIEQDTDFVILNSVYPFIMSICNEIHNHFLSCRQQQAAFHGVTITKDTENPTQAVIKANEKFDFKVGDFVIVGNCPSQTLTQVVYADDTQIKVDNTGNWFTLSDIPLTVLCILHVIFPADFLSTVLNMLNYDLFQRSSKELRQERLGNYTYTNFSPLDYYGDGAYPKEWEKTIKYYEIIQVH